VTDSSTIALRIFGLAAAGAAGALLRYAITFILPRSADGSIPWATVVANLLGCLLFGFLITLFERKFPGFAELRFILLVGFLGSLTTFSTYAFESVWMIRQSYWQTLFLYLMLQNALGFSAIYLGHTLAKIF